jgi:hypothetical protein
MKAELNGRVVGVDVPIDPVFLPPLLGHPCVCVCGCVCVCECNVVRATAQGDWRADEYVFRQIDLDRDQKSTIISD